MNESKMDEIDEIVEWQEHQYDPGYYTGGNIPPYAGPKNFVRLIGWSDMIFSVAAIIIIGYSLVSADFGSLAIKIFIALVASSIFSLFYLRGLRFVLTNKSEKEYYRWAKISGLVFILIIISLILSYIIGFAPPDKREVEVVITQENILGIDSVGYDLVNERGTYYIDLMVYPSVKIKCTQNQYEFLLKEKQYSFKIKYRWYIFDKNNAELLQLNKCKIY